MVKETRLFLRFLSSHKGCECGILEQQCSIFEPSLGQTLRASDSYLGEQFRRLRTRLGAPKAITAMGAKLARLVYRMLKYGQEYVDKGSAQYEAKHREQQIRHLKKKAAQHGFTLVSMPHPT